MLTLSVQPFHLLRKFPTLVINCVSIPPSANVTAAAELLANTTNDLQGKYPDGPVLITGDFNNCRLDSALPSFQQYVNVATRRSYTLDICYGNATDAYTSQAYPPLSFADQNVIFLLPQQIKLRMKERQAAFQGQDCPTHKNMNQQIQNDIYRARLKYQDKLK